MGKTCDLSEFDRGMIVGARRSGCSISQAADLLGFSRSTVSRVYREWRERQKTSSQRHYCGRKHLVDELGQVRLARIIEANRNATTAQITSLYNEGEKKGISQRTTRRALKQMGYSKELENQAASLTGTKSTGGLKPRPGAGGRNAGGAAEAQRTPAETRGPCVSSHAVRGSPDL